jgi:thiamine-monophosphate kinase
LSSAKQLGERNIIKLFQTCIDPMPGMLLPFGDDASAIDIGNDNVAVINVDMLVRKTDVPRKMSLWQAARKAVIMNLSDLAAKGAKPVALLVSVGLPSVLTETDILEIGKGLNAGAREYETYILGGDTNQAPDLIINCTAIGTCNKNQLMKRSGAKPKDILAVTGLFGKTASGLKILINNLPAPDLEKPLVESVLMPKARINEGTALAKSKAATACIDSSDGLAWSLHELSASSNVGFCIDTLPVDLDAENFAELHGFSSSDLVLYGGEEYELVVTVDPNRWQTAKQAVESVGGSLIKIGSVTEEQKIVLQSGENKVVVDARGWEHFKTELFEDKKSTGEHL